jgi:hypothetical protein
VPMERPEVAMSALAFVRALSDMVMSVSP